MKTKASIRILGVLFAFCFLGTLSYAQITITVLEAFNYPGGTATTSTVPYGINDRGDVVGVFTDADSASFGFVRFANGMFSPLIIEPNDTANFTEGRGINNSRTICGDYIGSDGHVHAFFRVGGTFTEYDIPEATGTVVLGINDAGDFAGSYDPDPGFEIPFISIGGTVTPIDIPGADFGAAYQINDANAFVGYYADFRFHGFYQDSTGALEFPIDPPGSQGTYLRGINDQNWIVGTYFDDEAQHGLLFIPPRRFVIFDYGGGKTSLNGINRAGNICGSYFDVRLHQTRGFIAAATRTAGD